MYYDAVPQLRLTSLQQLFQGNYCLINVFENKYLLLPFPVLFSFLLTTATSAEKM